MVLKTHKIVFFFFLSLITQVSLALDLELTQGISSALPITIGGFGASAEGEDIADIIKNDFQMTGQFRFIHTGELGADSIVSGQVNALGGGRYRVSFKLQEAVAQRRVLDEGQFEVNSRQLRNIAHHISDQVYEKLTGERGVFSTHIAYIVVERNGPRPRYALEVADVDGYNPQRLLIAPEPIMSPAWSPDGRQIAYVSFEKKKAQIFLVSVETGKRRLVTDFTGINGAPTWSPDGRQLAVVLSKTGSPKIYTIDLSSGAMKQLTFGDSMDTEPRFSPDGQSILFTSGRGGAPQVYQLSIKDGAITRLTYDGNYNARASYTPDKKHLVMMHRDDNGFSIAAQSSESGVIPLTSSPAAESPSVAPNGRLIIYATRYQNKGALAIVSIDGRANTRLPQRDADLQEPAWAPY